MKDTRSTGWKIPMLFCAAMLALVVVTGIVRHDDTFVPEIPPPLLEKTKAIAIRLEADEEGSAWKKDIAATAGAFATRAEKDRKIEILVRLILEAKRFDAACTAAVLMYDDVRRDAVLENIAAQSLITCEELPWAVMAAKGMTRATRMADVHQRIITQWEACGRK